jgi:hypothetical protein
VKLSRTIGVAEMKNGRWKRRSILLAGLLLLLGAGVAGAAAAQVGSRPGGGIRPSTVVAVPHGTVAGSGAITPGLNTGASGTPTYTAQTAAAYVTQNGLPPLSTSALTVVDAEFMTAGQVATRVHVSTAELDPARLVCFVEAHGDFSVSDPFSLRVTTVHTAWALFDAVTGNQLLVMLDGTSR